MAEISGAESDWTENLLVKYIGQKVSKLRWRSNGQLRKTDQFISGSWDDQDNSLCLWTTNGNENAETRSSLSLHEEPQLLCSALHDGSVTDIKFINSYQLVTSSSTGHVTIYNIDEQSMSFKQIQKWPTLHHNIYSLGSSCTNVSVNQSTIVTVGEDGKINALRLDNPKPMRTIDTIDGVTINAVSHVNSNEVATVNSMGHLNIWDLRTASSKSSKTMFLSGERISLESVDRHPYQPHLHVTGGADGIIGVWDIRHERYPVTLLEAHDNEVWEVKFHPSSPDNLFTCSEDGSTWYWDGASSSLRGSEGMQPKPSLLPTSDSTSHTSAWLYIDTNKHKLETYSLLPFNRLPVNSIDIDTNALICGTDGEAIIVVQDLPIK
eukprot:gene265-888_t